MEIIRAALPVLLGYLLGSVPFGYVVVRLWRNIDVRDYGSHNIGATNVLRVVGPIPALITLLGDIAKGTLPVLFAASPAIAGPAPHPWIVIASALAAILGHAYSLWFYLKERRFSRGKAVAAGLGAMLGFVLIHATPPAGLLIPLAIWLGVLMGPRLLGRRWGYVSLASILAAVSVAPTYFALGVDLPYVVFALLVAVFVVWKHKENIGRLLDGTEVRLGEKVPLAGVDDEEEVACAFMIHPMSPDDWWQTWRFRWALPLYRLGLLPESLIARAMLWMRPMKLDEIRGIRVSDNRRARVYLVGVPLLPVQIKENPGIAVERAVQAARLARELGASVIGLGAYWSVVGNKGADVQARSAIPVTNGGAYTAGTVRLAVPAMLRKLALRGVALERARVAVVGANGVVGFGICRSILSEIGALVMVGTSLDRLEKSAELLRRRYPEKEIRATTDLDEIRECDLIFTATSEPNPVVLPEHVRPGTLIYDLGRPPDVDEAVKEIEDVEVVPGGTVRPPGQPTGRLNIYFGTGQMPACMAETLIIALEGAYDRKSLGGEAKPENIDFFVRRAAELGFQVVEEGEVPPAVAEQRAEGRDFAAVQAD